VPRTNELYFIGCRAPMNCISSGAAHQLILFHWCTAIDFDFHWLITNQTWKRLVGLHQFIEFLVENATKNSFISACLASFTCLIPHQ
jgi:hypothetical protein